MRNIPLVWTKHLKTDKAKKDFEQYLRNSTLLIDRLTAVLEDRLQLLARENLGTQAYDNPSWAYKQAHINGAMTEIKQLLDLFNFTKETNDR